MFDSNLVMPLFGSNDPYDWPLCIGKKYANGARPIDCLSLLAFTGIAPSAFPASFEIKKVFADNKKQISFNKVFWNYLDAAKMRGWLRAALIRELRKAPKPLPEPCIHPDIPVDRYRGAVQEDFGVLLLDFLSARPQLPWFSC